MSQVQYHMVVPESTMTPYNNDTGLGGYTPFQSIDFNLAVPGRKLLKNSVRVEGRIIARKTGDQNKWRPDSPTGLTSSVHFNDNVKLDNVVGAHAFFDSWTCETQKKGVMENLQNYPRYISQHGRATLGADDMLSSKLVAECRGPYEVNGNYVLQPVADQAYVTGEAEQTLQRTAPSFSIAPSIMWNRQAGGDYSFDRNGFIRISCVLAANRHALFGGVGGDYVLEDVVCRFVSVPDDGTDEPMLMRSYVNVVSSLQSTATTISARVPSQQVNSVTMSFINQARMQSSEFCSTALEGLPKWESIEYLFANSMQNFITYKIVDEDDALRRGLESMESAGHSQVSAKTLKANRGTLFGLDFAEYVDLSQQKFTINLQIADASVADDPFDVHLFFNSLLQM